MDERWMMNGDDFKSLKSLDEVELAELNEAVKEIGEVMQRVLQPVFEAAQQVVETTIVILHGKMNDDPEFAAWCMRHTPVLYAGWQEEKARERSREDLAKKRKSMRGNGRHIVPPGR